MGGNPARMGLSDTGSLTIMIFLLKWQKFGQVFCLADSTKRKRPIAVTDLILSASVFTFCRPLVNPTAYLEIPPFLKNSFFNSVKRIPNEKKVSGSGSWECLFLAQLCIFPYLHLLSCTNYSQRALSFVSLH